MTAKISAVKFEKNQKLYYLGSWGKATLHLYVIQGSREYIYAKNQQQHETERTFHKKQ